MPLPTISPPTHGIRKAVFRQNDLPANLRVLRVTCGADAVVAFERDGDSLLLRETVERNRRHVIRRDRVREIASLANSTWQRFDQGHEGAVLLKPNASLLQESLTTSTQCTRGFLARHAEWIFFGVFFSAGMGIADSLSAPQREVLTYLKSHQPVDAKHLLAPIPDSVDRGIAEYIGDLNEGSLPLKLRQPCLWVHSPENGGHLCVDGLSPAIVGAGYSPEVAFADLHEALTAVLNGGESHFVEHSLGPLVAETLDLAEFSPEVCLRLWGAERLKSEVISMTIGVFAVNENRVRVNPLDTPFEPDDRFYEVSVRVDCSVEEAVTLDEQWMEEVAKIMDKYPQNPFLTPALFRLVLVNAD